MFSIPKHYREVLILGFFLGGVRELINGVSDSLATAGQVMKDVPQWLINTYPQANAICQEHLLPVLQHLMPPQDFQQLLNGVQQFTNALTPYQLQIETFGPIGVGLIVVLPAFFAVVLYKTLFAIPFFLASFASIEENPTFGLLLCATLFIALYWPVWLLASLTAYSVLYCLLRERTRRN